jgi:sugar lactone lactonase YvrE
MRVQPALLLMSATAWIASGQTYTISTFAGGALAVNIPGTSVSLAPNALQYLAADRAGNLFFVEQNTVLRLDGTTGILTLAAGNQTTGFSGDNGPATNAQLYYPQGLAVDSAGNIYIADTQNFRIRKVSNGVITTVAGNGVEGFSGDNGPATSAQLAYPQALAVDSAGNLYIAESANRVRKISNGVITTVAGNGTQGFSGDNGPATSAQLFDPEGLTADSVGNLYIADAGNERIRKVSNGVISTVAGNGTPGFSGDNGPANSAQLSQPWGVAVDSAGNIYIADVQNARIRKISNGVITTVAGNGTAGFSGDNGSSTNAQLNGPFGVTVDSGGNLYIGDQSNSRIRKVSSGIITTVAGNGMTIFSGGNGPATSAVLSEPEGVATDPLGNLYIADFGNNRILKVSSGVITTVVGNGTQGFSGDDGPATSAQLGQPEGVAVDSAGNLYIADTSNSRIRKVSNGVITTVAGNGTRGFGGDNGPAASAELGAPEGVAVDSAGNLYITDGTPRVRKVANGVITTVAGNGAAGFSGDNGPATSAQLGQPEGVAVDSAGNLYIGDSGNYRIRRVSNGVITTVAGNGTLGFSGDNGPATSAQLGQPAGIAVDAAGNLYIANSYRIRKVSNGVITTVAGDGTRGLSGDGGPAAGAQLSNSFGGITLDSAGNVYIADSDNSRIRLLTPSASSCTYSVTPTSLQAPAAGGNLTITIQTASTCALTVSNLPAWITSSSASLGAGSGTITLVVAPNTGAPLSATISISGVSVIITQAGQTSACTYAISPGGQTFAAAGGNGTINITAGPGCPWTAASTASWVTITGVGTGSGNGAVTYQAAANSGASRSGVVTIAGLSFTVEEGSASTAGFTTAGSMAQLASAGYWTTTITLVNTGSTAALARLNFFDNNGNPLLLPLSFPQPAATAGAAGPLLAATLDRTLNPGAELVIVTTGPSTQTTQVGWAQLLTNGTIGGFAVFSDTISGDQEAVVPLETRNASTYVLSFDNSNGADTGIALANLSGQALNAAVTISDDTGALIMSDTIALPAMGHTSIDMATRYGSSTAGRRGTLQFTSPSPGQISVLGLRFTPAGAFTTIPPLAK